MRVPGFHLSVVGGSSLGIQMWAGIGCTVDQTGITTAGLPGRQGSLES